MASKAAVEVRLPPEIEAEIEAAWNSVDRDGDGTLSANELDKLMKHMVGDESYDPAMGLLARKSLDLDSDGSVTRDEFVSQLREWFVRPGGVLSRTLDESTPDRQAIRHDIQSFFLRFAPSAKEAALQKRLALRIMGDETIDLSNPWQTSTAPEAIADDLVEQLEQAENFVKDPDIAQQVLRAADQGFSEEKGELVLEAVEFLRSVLSCARPWGQYGAAPTPSIADILLGTFNRVAASNLWHILGTCINPDHVDLEAIAAVDEDLAEVLCRAQVLALDALALFVQGPGVPHLAPDDPWHPHNLGNEVRSAMFTVAIPEGREDGRRVGESVLWQCRRSPASEVREGAFRLLAALAVEDEFASVDWREALVLPESVGRGNAYLQARGTGGDALRPCVARLVDESEDACGWKELAAVCCAASALARGCKNSDEFTEIHAQLDVPQRLLLVLTAALEDGPRSPSRRAEEDGVESMVLFLEAQCHCVRALNAYLAFTEGQFLGEVVMRVAVSAWSGHLDADVRRWTSILTRDCVEFLRRLGRVSHEAMEEMLRDRMLSRVVVPCISSPARGNAADTARTACLRLLDMLCSTHWRAVLGETGLLAQCVRCIADGGSMYASRAASIVADMTSDEDEERQAEAVPRLVADGAVPTLLDALGQFRVKDESLQALYGARGYVFRHSITATAIRALGSMLEWVSAHPIRTTHGPDNALLRELQPSTALPPVEDLLQILAEEEMRAARRGGTFVLPATDGLPAGEGRQVFELSMALCELVEREFHNSPAPSSDAAAKRWHQARANLEHQLEQAAKHRDAALANSMSSDPSHLPTESTTTDVIFVDAQDPSNARIASVARDLVLPAHLRRQAARLFGVDPPSRLQIWTVDASGEDQPLESKSDLTKAWSLLDRSSSVAVSQRTDDLSRRGHFLPVLVRDPAQNLPTLRVNTHSSAVEDARAVAAAFGGVHLPPETLSRAIHAEFVRRQKLGGSERMNEEDFVAFLTKSLRLRDPSAVGAKILPLDKARAFFRAVDVDKNGSVTYAETVVGLGRALGGSRDQQIRFAFSAIDKDGSGEIDATELKELVRLGTGSDDEWCASIAQDLIRQFDSDNSGALNVKEFTLACDVHPNLYRSFGGDAASGWKVQEPKSHKKDTEKDDRNWSRKRHRGNTFRTTKEKYGWRRPRHESDHHERKRGRN